MDIKHLIMLALQLAIIGTVLSFGLRATFVDLLYLVRRPGLLFRSLLAVLVIMPIVAIALVKLFDLRTETQVLLLALSISPTPPLLPKREEQAGGHAAYGLGLMLVLAVVAIFSTPLSAELLSTFFGRSVTMDAAAIARIVVVMMLVPCIAGVALRALWPNFAERLAKFVSVAATVLLLVAVVVLLAGAWRAIVDAVGNGTVLAIAAFVVVGLVVGHLLGMPGPEHSSVLAFSSACRHPAIAFAVASANFADQHFGGTLLLYLLISLVLGVPYMVWRKRRRADGATG